MVNKEFKVIDASVAEFSEWSDPSGRKRTGMQRKDSGRSHGVARVVLPDEWIVEGTSNDGRAIGLVRSVYYDRVLFGLYRDGEELAMVEFDAELQEVKRNDKSNYLREITA